jgi:L-ascorbate metabolism protein UlaG (beta-lactamase superfamily)
MLIIYVLIAIALIVGAIALFMKQPKFGKPASGQYKSTLEKSAQYRNGSFQNQSETPALTNGGNYWSVSRKFFFNKSPLNKPPFKLPSQKVNLNELKKEEDTLVWFGHSSYFMQISGKRFLVDPVLSGSASPIPSTTRSFPGSDIYSADDIPEIDYLILTHDHWDHLDYLTLQKLKLKIRTIITSLGVGSHLKHWGFKEDSIIENDWFQISILEDGFSIVHTPARHFSGRGFKRNQTLWSSFVLQTPTLKLYLGGDSGYDEHFATIGQQYGPFDLAVLECGQYNEYWKHIHMMPEEVVQAGIDLQAKMILPVHWGKFALSLHDWNEPIKRIVKEGEKKKVTILHPMIGEKITLLTPQVFPRWWDS